MGNLVRVIDVPILPLLDMAEALAGQIMAWPDLFDISQWHDCRCSMHDVFRLIICSGKRDVPCRPDQKWSSRHDSSQRQGYF